MTSVRFSWELGLKKQTYTTPGHKSNVKEGSEILLNGVTKSMNSPLQKCSFDCKIQTEFTGDACQQQPYIPSYQVDMCSHMLVLDKTCE